MLENAKIITPDIPFDRYRDLPAVQFRRTFTMPEFKRATLSIAALGIGYFYINGKPVTDAKFLSPVSDYTKTVWYNTFDVTQLLTKGENVIAAVVGNGWFNEAVASAWDYDSAPWRANPGLICELTADGNTVLVSDGEFVFSLDSPVIYNHLRLCEVYDSRKYDPDWNTLAFDARGWHRVRTSAVTACLRECDCELVRECEELRPIETVKTGSRRYLVKFEKNISGYVRLTVNERKGTVVTVRYAEDYDEYNAPVVDTKSMEAFYPANGARVVTDTFVANGEKFTWSPQFTYHGFCCVEIEGVTGDFDVSAVFVHQDIARRATFECSNGMLTELFELGALSCYSNMFYIPTDCPTREKLGWMNDARSSADNLMTVFDSEKFFEKWLQDIYDAMREDGALPGIVPTSGWGFDWGNGPISDGALFEIPYRIYLHSGNKQPLIDSIPYFKRYLDYIEKQGYCIGLGDWAPPVKDTRLGAEYVCDILCLGFYDIAKTALCLAGDDFSDIQARRERLRDICRDKYLDSRGMSVVDRQTVVALLIYYGVCDSIEPLKGQLKRLIEKADFHHDCGMLGLPHLYDVLEMCGLDDYAYRIVTADGFPSYSYWLNEGNARSLHEMWDNSCSRNHHMYSDFMTWLLRRVVGIRESFQSVDVSPCFFDGVDWARGEVGGVRVSWTRDNDAILLSIDSTRPFTYNAKQYPAGKYTFFPEGTVLSGKN